MYTEIKGAYDSLSDGEFSFGDVTGVADVGLAALGAFLDPAGALVGAVLGPLLDWVAANVSFVKEPLDLLLGDPPEIMDYGNTWTDSSKQLVEQGNQHVTMIQGELASWSGPAREAYMEASRTLNQSFQKSSQLAERMGQAVRFAGTVVGILREAVWGLIKELVISLVTNAVIAAAAAIPSFGSSLATYTAWAAGKVAIVMGKASKAISKVFSKLSRFTRKIGPLSRMFAKASQHFADLAVKYGRSVGKMNGANNNTENVYDRNQAIRDEKPDVVGNDAYDRAKDVDDAVNKTDTVMGDDTGEVQDL